MKIGDLVGGNRWPASGNHPDCWGQPWGGIVLEQTDPRAWAGSIAFPVSCPNPDAVKAHVEHLKANSLMDTVPVLWDFGENGTKIFWHKPEHLKPYAEDYMDWIAARDKARQLLKVIRAIAQGVAA